MQKKPSLNTNPQKNLKVQYTYVGLGLISPQSHIIKLLTYSYVYIKQQNVEIKTCFLHKGKNYNTAKQ
jgi:hypothetical protein